MTDQAKDNVTPNRLIVRHLSGSKANQVEEFPLLDHPVVSIGRTATSSVKYDPDRDDLVSREHAKIEQDKNDPTRFTIEDLSSRNGTFVNKQRIIGVAMIKPGDVIQFGPGGPEFEFDLDPRPDSLMRATRLADTPSARPTRASGAAALAPDRSTAAPSATGSSQRPGVGRETLERVVAETKGETQRTVMMASGGLLVLIALVASYLVFLRPEPTLPEIPRDNTADVENVQDSLSQQGTRLSDLRNKVGMNASEIYAKNQSATVYFEAAWRLQHTPSGGRQVFHQYVDIRVPAFTWYEGFDAAGYNFIAGYENVSLGTYAAYMLMDDGTLEPVLTLEDGGGLNAPVGGMHSGSGFVVTNDGFIMTNRHVAASWLTDYVFPDDAFPGIVYAQAGGEYVPVGTVDERGMTPWIPSRTRSLEFKMLGGPKVLEGENVVLDVTFSKNERRVPAQLVGINPGHDVAMVKVNMPGQLPKVELAPADHVIQTGDAVTVLGYPAIAPPVFTLRESGDYFNRHVDISNVPDPTVTDGTLGRIIRGTQAPAGRTKYEYWSSFGDAYQLTIGATGSGNSGGPVFDNQGRVVGIFFAGSWDPDATRITFAVPIKYAHELMGPQSVIE